MDIVGKDTPAADLTGGEEIADGNADGDAAADCVSRWDVTGAVVSFDNPVRPSFTFETTALDGYTKAHFKLAHSTVVSSIFHDLVPSSICRAG